MCSVAHYHTYCLFFRVLLRQVWRQHFVYNADGFPCLRSLLWTRPELQPPLKICCCPGAPVHPHMCVFHRRLVWPILLPAPRRSTNNDHRAQTDNHHSSVDGVVPCASKFREKRCWCNLLRCNRCTPRIVLVPMPRVQGQRSTDLGGVTAAPEDRLLSFRLSLRRLLSPCSDFYWFTTCSCSTLSTMDYGQIWKTTLANFNSANDEPGKVCTS